MAIQGEHGISWTQATWNCLRGCSRVSTGCENCYAERLAATRLAEGPYKGLTDHNGRWNGKIQFVEKHLHDPLKWKQPMRVFVNSMSDVFHGNVKQEWIISMFAVMRACPQHQFQILTKRPERMRSFMNDADCEYAIVKIGDALAANRGIDACIHKGVPFPSPNIWLGVSAENQETADDRIPILLHTKAAVRWVSAEPLIGAMTLYNYLRPSLGVPSIDWVVAGGESGPDARVMEPRFARTLQKECALAGVPFHFKQWGEWAPAANHVDSGHGNGMIKIGKRKAGDLLDGKQYHEYPR